MPSAPILNPSDVSGPIPSENVTNRTSLDFSGGQSNAGYEVDLLEDGQEIYSTTADGNGNYSFSDVGAPEADGTYDYSVQDYDLDGTPVAQSPDTQVTIERGTHVTGISVAGNGIDGNGNGDVPANTQITYTVSFDHPVVGGDGAGASSSFLQLDNGRTAGFSGFSADGTQATFTYVTQGGDDVGQLQVSGASFDQIRDHAGNVPELAGAQEPGALRVDTSAPSVSEGVAGTGAPRTVSVSGNVSGYDAGTQVTVTEYDAGGNALGATVANVDGAGNYQATMGVAATDVYFVASNADRAGNAGQSGGQGYHVPNPGVTDSATANGADATSIHLSGSVSDFDPTQGTVTVTETDAAGNVVDSRSVGTGDGNFATDFSQTTPGHYTFTASYANGVGEVASGAAGYDVPATATTPVGNPIPAPTPTSYSPKLSITATETGSNPDLVTVSGTITGYDPASPIIVVNELDSTGNVVGTQQAVANPDGAFSVQFVETTPGTYGYEATNVPTTGTPATSDEAFYTVPQGEVVTPPAIPVTPVSGAPTLALSPASDTGTSSSDRITDAPTLTFTGTAAAGSTVTLVGGPVGGQAATLGTATAGADGTDVVSGVSAPVDGGYAFVATADSDGAPSAPSNEVDVTVDRTAPTVSSLTQSGKGIDADGGGSVAPGTTVTYDLHLTEGTYLTPAADGSTPDLLLSNGDRATLVPSSAAAGSTDLEFQYVVKGGDTPYLYETQYEANGASVTDAAGNALDGNSVAARPPEMLQVDGTAPRVASLTQSGSGIDADGGGDVGAGVAVTYDLHLTEGVTLTPAADGSEPDLLLSNGQRATLVASSATPGTTDVQFRYVTQAGQDTPYLYDAQYEANGSSATDRAGNVLDGNAVDARPSEMLRVDTTAPGVTLSGTTATDAQGETTLALTGEATGLDGTADAKATYAVYDRTAPAGSGPVATGAVAADGTFSYADATHVGPNDLYATVTDGAGNVGTSDDVTYVAQPASVGAFALSRDAAVDTGSSQTDGVTAARTLAFAGTAAADSLVRLTVQAVGADGTPGDATVVGTTVADANGDYAFGSVDAPAQDGRYVYQVADSHDGTTFGPGDPIDVTIDRTAPTAAVTGTTSTDGSGETTLTLHGTSSAVAGTEDGGSTYAVYDGTAPAGSAPLATGTVAADGTFSFSEPTKPGANDLYATVTDAAGNVGTSNDATYGAAAGGVTSFGLSHDPAVDTGSSQTDGVTAARTLTFAGTATPDSEVTLLMEDADASVTPVATAQVGSDGTFAFSGVTAPAADGQYQYSVSDAHDGQSSGPVLPTTVTVDRTAPTATLGLEPSTTDFEDVSDVTLSGTAAGYDPATAKVTVTDKVTGMTYSAALDAQGGYSVEATLAAGHHDLVTTTADAAGNVGSSADVSYDVTAPKASAPRLTASTDLGASATDGVTSAANGLEFTGTGLPAGTTVNVYEVAKGPLGGATSEVTPVLVGSGTTDASGAYDVKGTSDLPDGIYDVAVLAGTYPDEEAYGEGSYSPTSEVTIDRSSPAVAIDQAGGATAAPSVTLTGHVTSTSPLPGDVGDTVTVSRTVNGQRAVVGTGKVASDGSYSVPVSLVQGPNVITVEDTTVAGVTGSASVTYDYAAATSPAPVTTPTPVPVQTTPAPVGTPTPVQPAPVQVQAAPSGSFDQAVTSHGPLSGTITGQVADVSKVASVELYEGTTDLGAATVGADGGFSYLFKEPAGFHQDINAVVTGTDGQVTDVQSHYDLTTGVQGKPYAGYLDVYGADDTFEGQYYYRKDGDLLYRDTFRTDARGDQIYTYSGGDFFRDKDYTSFTDTYDASGRLVGHTEVKRPGASDGTGTTTAGSGGIFGTGTSAGTDSGYDQGASFAHLVTGTATGASTALSAAATTQAADRAVVPDAATAPGEGGYVTASTAEVNAASTLTASDQGTARHHA